MPSPLRRATIAAGAVAGALVLLAVAGIALLWFLQRGAALPNVAVAGADVGGADPATIRERLAPLAQSREAGPLVVGLGDDQYEVTPVELGHRVDLDRTVDAALRVGRAGLPGDILTRVRALRRTTHVELVQVTDRAGLTAFVDDLADELDRDERTASVAVDPDTLDIEAVPALGEIVVDREATVDALHEALHGDLGGPGEVAVVATTTEAPIDDADLDAVVAQVERAIAEELVLHANDAELTLTPHDLAAVLDVVEVDGGVTGTTLELRVVPEAVDDVLGTAARARFDVTPRNARYTASRTPPARFDAQGSTSFQPVAAEVGLEEGRDGAAFSPELAAEQLTEALRSGARELQLRLETIEPELSTDRARELQPTHLLGTFTTYYDAGQARGANIRRLADTVNDTLVLPGEQFSINGVSGQRTCASGYLPAGTIIAGELVDTCAGGVSQFGTTTFNAAFFSGVQLDQWRAHSWYISRYPMGREATLSYPELDVKFTNTTDGAIVVTTTHSATSVTVSLYGRPIAERVRATHGTPTSPRDFPTQVRRSSNLCVGQSSVQQGGAGGFTVEVQRHVERAGGTDTQTIRTVYQPQTRIVVEGTASCPAPAPSDDEDDDEAEDDEDD